MWDEQRFALGLAKLVETDDATDAHVMLQALVVSVCRKWRMPDDAGDVLQNTWGAIIDKARAHIPYPRIARQVPAIARNQAKRVVNGRERRRSLEQQFQAFLRDSGTGAAEDLSLEEVNIDEELAILMLRLKEENKRQFDAVKLTLQSTNQEEARRKWETLYGTSITPDNFRKLHSRGTKRMRHFREQSND